MRTIITEFDKTRDFEEYVEPLMKEAIRQAKIHDIPLFANTCIKSEKDKTIYKNYHVSTVLNHYELYDDQIRKHILICNGFEAVMPSVNPTLTMEDVEFILE